ncbi:MAG: glucose-6-phosphate isomerase family protein [archaeon]
MIDLKKTGLDIEYDENKKEMIFEGKKIAPTIRRLKDMADVITDKKWLGTAEKEIRLYYMFRDISKKDDKETIEKNNLRYDITVIPPNTLGREYIKTAGHAHPLIPDTSVTYTELYEVISGEGLYLLQKTDGNKVRDAYFIKAKAGEKIIIPPGYSHITINTKDTRLIMSNWVARNFTSLYENIRTMKGGAYYVTTEKTIKNPAYANRSDKIRFKKPDNPQILGLRKSEPIYGMIKDPFRLKFLTEPQNHHRLFEEIMKKPATETPIE